jgi:hypothetical protein
LIFSTRRRMFDQHIQVNQGKRKEGKRQCGNEVYIKVWLKRLENFRRQTLKNKSPSFWGWGKKASIFLGLVREVSSRDGKRKVYWIKFSCGCLNRWTFNINERNFSTPTLCFHHKKSRFLYPRMNFISITQHVLYMMLHK